MTGHVDRMTPPVVAMLYQLQTRFHDIGLEVRLDHIRDYDGWKVGLYVPGREVHEFLLPAPPPTPDFQNAALTEAEGKIRAWVERGTPVDLLTAGT